MFAVKAVVLTTREEPAVIVTLVIFPQPHALRATTATILVTVEAVAVVTDNSGNIAIHGISEMVHLRLVFND